MEERKRRRSKDEKVNREGRRLVEFMEEIKWAIFNGNIIEDKEEECTFTGGRGKTIIDYIMGDREVKKRIVRNRVGESMHVGKIFHFFSFFRPNLTKRRTIIMCILITQKDL